MAKEGRRHAAFVQRYEVQLQENEKRKYLEAAFVERARAVADALTADEVLRIMRVLLEALELLVRTQVRVPARAHTRRKSNGSSVHRTRRRTRGLRERTCSRARARSRWRSAAGPPPSCGT